MEKDKQKARKYGKGVGERLRKHFLKPNEKSHDTNLTAEALAQILDACVHKEWSGGNYMTLDWAFERFWGNVVHDALPTFDYIYETLVKRNHTEKNAFEWNDLDYHAFYEPCDNRHVLVLDSQGRRTICIWERNSIRTKLHVRRLWPKNTKITNHYLKHVSLKQCREKNFYFGENGIGIGDCRDADYMFSYENIFNDPKVDRAINHFVDLEVTLDFINCLKNELKEVEKNDKERFIKKIR